MIKDRLEFGLQEPHPRHGRVCVEGCEAYAFELLDSIVFPIHDRFFAMEKEEKQEGVAATSVVVKSMLGEVRTHRTMIKMYKQICEAIIKSIQTPPSSSGDTSAEALAPPSSNDGAEAQLLKSIYLLKSCVDALESEMQDVTSLPSVLCHCDLQPQNLIFRRNSSPTSADDSSVKTIRDGPPLIASVLDWEEAALADPRFELLLICRKVVSNLEQAKNVWKYYEKEMTVRHPTIFRSTTTNASTGIGNSPLGSVEVWLKLEGVHSLCMLFLQCLKGGHGRNGWENANDIVLKSQREFIRLRELGWDFCNN
jgi:thiamine kinase-like enzyme